MQYARFEMGGAPDATGFEAEAALEYQGRPDEAIRVCVEALIPHLPRYQRSGAAYAAGHTDGPGLG